MDYQVTEAAAGEDITRWLAKAERPLALCMSDTGMSMAAGDQALMISLGGDLLNPGMDPAEAWAIIAPELAAHPAIVHDSKALLHMLQKNGLPLPETFDWDIMLGAYLMDPQQKSYTLISLLEGMP